MDGDSQRQVKTPWFAYEIPFAKAAGIGTRKVIHDHSTIGIVITTDGTITDIPRENYKDAERMTIQELNGIGKPFIVLVNSKEPQENGRRTPRRIWNRNMEYGRCRSTVKNLPERISARFYRKSFLSFRYLKFSFLFRNGWRCFQETTRSNKI